MFIFLPRQRFKFLPSQRNCLTLQLRQCQFCNQKHTNRRIFQFNFQMGQKVQIWIGIFKFKQAKFVQIWAHYKSYYMLIMIKVHIFMLFCELLLAKNTSQSQNKWGLPLKQYFILASHALASSAKLSNYFPAAAHCTTYTLCNQYTIHSHRLPRTFARAANTAENAFSH